MSSIINRRAQADRTEHWRAFDKAWFARHQAWLLCGLNTPGLAIIVRGLLRIRMADVGMSRGTRIWAIAPNSYTVRLPDLTSDPKLVVTYTAATYKVGQGMFAL